MKKITCLWIAIVLFGMIWGNASKNIVLAEDVLGQIDLLSLGDSIATGYGLENYNVLDLSQAKGSYINQLGQALKIVPVNLAVDGITTSELLEQIGKQDVQDQIKRAKYITISIGGNNLLRPLLKSFTTDLSGAQLGASMDSFEDITINFDEDFKNIISQITKLAPNAKIIVSTLYNPYEHLPLSILSASTQVFMDRMNQTIIETRNQGPLKNAYQIVDVARLFSEESSGSLVNASLENGNLNFDPHPTQAGHKVIYKGYALLMKGYNFTDIQEHWAKNSIFYLISLGHLDGLNATQFAPNDTISRAQLVKLLYHIAEGDRISGNKSTSFVDVDEKAWYAAYIGWAATKGIVEGNQQNQFLPKQSVSRQDLCVMLSRFIKIYGVSSLRAAINTQFTDDLSISSYAKDAVYQIKNLGLIAGKENNVFDPKGLATRAETAVMIERYLTQ